MCFEQHLNTGWRFLGCKIHLNLHLHSHQYCWPFQGGGSDVTCMYFCMAQRVSSCLCLACYIIMFVQLAWALWSPSGGGEGRGVERAASGCLSFSFLTFTTYVIIVFFSSSWCHWKALILACGSSWTSPLWATSWENLFAPYVNNKGADHPAHLRSLISAFLVRWLDNISSFYIWNFKPLASFCGCIGRFLSCQYLVATPKDRFSCDGALINLGYVNTRWSKVFGVLTTILQWEALYKWKLSCLMTIPTKWLCAQQRLFLLADSEDWSDWADAQADLSLRWEHMLFFLFCHEAAKMTSMPHHD